MSAQSWNATKRQYQPQSDHPAALWQGIQKCLLLNHKTLKPFVSSVWDDSSTTFHHKPLFLWLNYLFINLYLLFGFFVSSKGDVLKKPSLVLIIRNYHRVSNRWETSCQLNLQQMKDTRSGKSNTNGKNCSIISWLHRKLQVTTKKETFFVVSAARHFILVKWLLHMKRHSELNLPFLQQICETNLKHMRWRSEISE